MENKRLQQLKDGEHIAEEGHVVLLSKLLHVQVHATVQETCDHRQVSGKKREKSQLFEPSPMATESLVILEKTQKYSCRFSPKQKDRVRHSHLPTGEVCIRHTALCRL